MKALLGLFVGLFLSLMLCLFVGENPIHILSILVKSAFGSWYDLGWTLFYTTAFVFTGLSVLLIFQSGMFNVGAEGQLNLGALGISAFALCFPAIPAPWSILGAVLSGAIFAGLSGLFVAWLKVRKNSHEVITTIMMNFISAGIVSYFVLNVFKNPDSQNPETAIFSQNYLLFPSIFSKYFPDTPLNSSLILAVVVAIFLHLFLQKTSLGFKIRSLGENENAAASYGIPIARIKLLVFTLGAALAAGAALNDLLGTSGRLKLGFSADYGFVGIAVAMLAGGNALLVLPSAFLFGALHKGSLDLDMESNFITKDFARIIQAVLILSVIIFSRIKAKK